MHEARPFMSCLLQKAEIFIDSEKTAEGVAIMEELLELNEHDNQGVRYQLLSALITLGDMEKFKKYDKMFADENSTQMLYSRALFAFKTEGDSANARKKFVEAFKANPFVVKILADENFQFSKIERYSLGSPEEAEVYLMHGIIPWDKTKGALDWLFDVLYEMMSKKMNAKPAKTQPKTKKIGAPKKK
jgi:tetratricopeptide (TPR) repeat protein